MNAPHTPQATNRGPLWIIAFAAVAIAVCLIALVVKSYSAKPVTIAAQTEVTPEAPAPVEIPTTTSAVAPNAPISAAAPGRPPRPAPAVTINQVDLSSAAAPPPALNQTFYSGAPAAATTVGTGPAPVTSGALITYHALPNGSKMKIEGTSTVHDWSMESPVLGGTFTAPPDFPADPTGPVAASVFLPVRSFKSYAKRMDEVMQEHMKEPQFKRIEYRLLELQTKPAAGAPGPAAFDATGLLTVAGQTRTNTMPVTIEKLPENKLKVVGTTGVRMTDFGIEPINIMLGTIKTGDDVKLSFEWLLAQDQQQAQR